MNQNSVNLLIVILTPKYLIELSGQDNPMFKNRLWLFVDLEEIKVCFNFSKQSFFAKAIKKLNDVILLTCKIFQNQKIYNSVKNYHVCIDILSVKIPTYIELN